MNFAILLFTHCLLMLVNPGPGRRAADREEGRPHPSRLQPAATGQADHLASLLHLDYGQKRRVRRCSFQHLQQLDSLLCPLTCPALADSLLTSSQFLLGMANEEAHYYQALSRVLTTDQYVQLLRMDSPERVARPVAVSRRPLMLRW